MTEVITSIKDMRLYIDQHRANGKVVGFVPTMGALHQGHGVLFDHSLKQCDITVASIFVNLKQFAPNEDFDKYPRPVEKDIEFLRQKGVDALFLPSNQEIYPEHFSTLIQVSGPAKGLESLSRPHFFEGVATIVTKLFLIVKPDHAFFGEKDYQQFCVIHALIRDLCLDIILHAVPTKREPDGLAFSSRNMYLSDQERKIAPLFYKALRHIEEDLKNHIPFEKAKLKARDYLLDAGFSSIDYLEQRTNHTLLENPSPKDRRLLGAVFLGKVRLIDNIYIDI